MYADEEKVLAIETDQMQRVLWGQSEPLDGFHGSAGVFGAAPTGDAEAYASARPP